MKHFDLSTFETPSIYEDSRADFERDFQRLLTSLDELKHELTDSTLSGIVYRAYELACDEEMELHSDALDQALGELHEREVTRGDWMAEEYY